MPHNISDFLFSHVIGKTLETDEIVYSLEEGKLEGAYSDRMLFSDFLSSGSGIQFNMTTITREKIYVLDKNGSRGEVRKDFTGTSVFHYELAFRKSTEQFSGYMRCLSSSVLEHTMEAVVYGVYDVKIKNGELSWKEQQLLYRDMPAPDGKFRPVAFDAHIRFFLEEEKLRFEYIPFYYDVEIPSMKKIPSKDHYPAFMSKEK
ncbi:MAG: hypothetical protein LUG18_11225 [Candidatus Azobacteroides sp.]|nr:hypothetical protein [Candidatus Azobacteroides sp.]